MLGQHEFLTKPVHFAVQSVLARSVRLSVPWRSCLGYRHAGCLQLSHRRLPEMCGLRTRPRTDVDPPRFMDPWTDADYAIVYETICHRRTAIGGGRISSRPPPGRYLVAQQVVCRHTQAHTETALLATSVATGRISYCV